MESGSAGSLPSVEASRGDLLWDAFAANVTVCASVPRGSTFACLRNATTAALLSWGAAVDVIPDLFHFVPVIGGPAGLLPDIPPNFLAAGNFTKIPFISGAFSLFLLIALDRFPEVVTPAFQLAGGTLLASYPDDPVAGSPFGTGNETFGLSCQYKHASALFGDLSFRAMRQRIQAVATAGVTGYAYVFADQHVATADLARGVYHASEIPYVYSSLSIAEANEESGRVSFAMVDYWVSFAVGGTPNDGKGLTRTNWPRYTPNNQLLIQFDTTSMASNSSNATFAIVVDDYRAQYISAIISVAPGLRF